MGKTFNVNVNRFNPYANFCFLIYFGASTDPVAGVSKITGLKRSSDVIEYKAGGDRIVHKGPGRTKYDALTLERGVTHDADFEVWANAAQSIDKGVPATSLKDLRKELRIDLLNESGQPVHRYLIHGGWVSEYQALGDLDGGGNAVILEHVKVELESWEHDLSLTEPTEA